MGTRRRLGLVIAAALALSSALVIWWFLQEGPRDPGHVEVEMASQGAHGEKSIARGAGPALEGTPARESGNEVPRYGTLGKPSASSSPAPKLASKAEITWQGAIERVAIPQ